MKIEVLDPGFYVAVQDAGRNGYRRFGVAPGGAMDRFALAAANRLVGNPASSACIEVGPPGASFLADEDSLLAMAGSGFDLQVNGRSVPPWTVIFIRAGSVITVTGNGQGCRVCLAFSGGVQGCEELGSQATVLKAGFGSLLQAGDRIETGSTGVSPANLAGRTLPVEFRPLYTQEGMLEVIAGPQEEMFSAAGLEVFYGAEYRVSLQTDSMGARLEGPGVAHFGGADILSEGMVFGSIQVTKGGQPIVMLGDCPATGGYSKIATVVSADLPILAQLLPGYGRVRFRLTSVEAAQERYRALMYGVERGILEVDEI